MEEIRTGRNLYGNIAIHSQDDIFMCYLSERKLNFYLKNDLVEKVGDKKYKLKFTPQGLGYNESDRFPFAKGMEIPRENKCVVSGITDVQILDKHHIVPRMFRRGQPEYRWNFQLVVLLEHKIHKKYTHIQQQFYIELAKKYGIIIPSLKDDNKYKFNRIIATLLNYGEKLPLERKRELEDFFTQETGLIPSAENLSKEIEKLKLNRFQSFNLGKAVMDKVSDYREFQMIWLNHFIKHTRPQHLPMDIILTYLQ